NSSVGALMKPSAHEMDRISSRSGQIRFTQIRWDGMVLRAGVERGVSCWIGIFPSRKSPSVKVGMVRKSKTHEVESRVGTGKASDDYSRPSAGEPVSIK